MTNFEAISDLRIVAFAGGAFRGRSGNKRRSTFARIAAHECGMKNNFGIIRSGAGLMSVE